MQCLYKVGDKVNIFPAAVQHTGILPTTPTWAQPQLSFTDWRDDILSGAYGLDMREIVMVAYATNPATNQDENVPFYRTLNAQGREVLWADEAWLVPFVVPAPVPTNIIINPSPAVLPGHAQQVAQQLAKLRKLYMPQPSQAQTDPALDALDEQIRQRILGSLDDREFDGFCTPCGGLRKHRLGCPVKRVT